jgi:hypothetical protein
MNTEPLTQAELDALMQSVNSPKIATGHVIALPRVSVPGMSYSEYQERMKHAPKTPDSAYPIPPTNQRTRDLREEDVLRLMQNEQEGDYGVGHRLVDHGWHWKIVAARLGKMCDKGLIEYGTALFTPWLVKK